MGWGSEASVRVGTSLVVLLGLAAATGCTQAPDDETGPHASAQRTVVTRAAAPLPRLPHAHRRVGSVLGAVRVSRGRDIHLGDRVLDVSPLHADAAVATLGGVYFLEAGDLWFADAHSAHATGFSSVSRMVATRDGRYLAIVDRNHGPARPGTPPLAAVVVYDARTGRLVLHSRAGMGRIGRGLAASYTPTRPQVRSISDRAVIATTPDGPWRYPLRGGRPAPLH